MVDDINKKIDGAPQNPEDSDNLFEKFRDHLGYLAKEVYETSKNAYDKALQSLQEWLLSQKEEVQKNTVDALGDLRALVDSNLDSNKGKIRRKDNRNLVGNTRSFSAYDRNLVVQESIAEAAKNVSDLIALADKDRDLIASLVGKLMLKILRTEG